ncbi:hypothetical protein ABEB36_014456 [Hypothenemus hampei]|uniref:Uncharacterized protein n=1 Tax=Hypothenemus hampei TaxID=57062 RepID=A0ABD1E2R3_HYPHA
MNRRSRVRQASEIQSLYTAADTFDDQESESEAEDIVEEQIDESEEEGADDVEAVESESSDNGNGPSTSKGKRGRPSYLRGKNDFQWSLHMPDSRGKRNKPSYIPTPIGRAATVKSPLEAWSVLFDE